MRAYILVFKREQLFGVFPAGTSATDDPAKAFQAAKASGAPWIASWNRYCHPMVKDGHSLIELDGARASRILRTDNTMLVSLNHKDFLTPIDPDLVV